MRKAARFSALLVCAISLGPARGAAATLDFAIGPGLSFTVPDGWTACDDATRAQLGASLPTGEMKTHCDQFNDAGGAREIGRSDGSLAFSFILHGQAAFNSAENVTGEQISKASDGLCLSTFHIAKGATPCIFELTTVAGRRAVAGRVSSPDGKFELGRMVVFPVGAGDLGFILSESSPSDDARDKVNAILESIRLGKTE